MRFLQAPFAAALSFAGLLISCNHGTEPEHLTLGGSPYVFLVPARIKTVTAGGTDTAISLLRYDSTGTLIREIRPTTFREWDSLGRYLGVRLKDSAFYLERVTWIGEDSAVRIQPPNTVVHDHFFNRRPNCWCADSIQHTVGDSTRVIRKFLFDEYDNPIRVSLTWATDSSVDITQAYANSYDTNGRLIRVLSQDAESGTVVSTIRWIEYDTLKNVTEAR